MIRSHAERVHQSPWRRMGLVWFYVDPTHQGRGQMSLPAYGVRMGRNSLRQCWSLEVHTGWREFGLDIITMHRQSFTMTLRKWRYRR